MIIVHRFSISNSLIQFHCSSLQQTLLRHLPLQAHKIGMTNLYAVLVLMLAGFVSQRMVAQQAVASDSTKIGFVDSTSAGIKKGPIDASNFGLLFGFNYSQYYMSSNPFFVDSLTTMGNSKVKNNLGLTAGLFYNFKLSEKLILRSAVEATILPSVIEYDIVRKKTESWIYPLTIDIPFYFIYGNHDRESQQNKSMQFNWVAAIRPVFPLSIMSSEQPILKDFNLNADIGCSIPFVLKNTSMKAEVFYSFGMLNLIGEDPDSYKTSSISSLRRNFIGLRFFFN